MKRTTMPNFFYLDANGQKQGPVNDQQLKALAAQGAITPDTPLVADTGHKGKAGQIRGLFNAVPPQLPVSQSVPVSAAEKSGGSSWQVTIIGVVLILIICGIGWKIINSLDSRQTNEKKPPVHVESPVNEKPPAQERDIDPNPFLNVLPD